MAMPPSSLISRKRRRCSLPALSVFLLSLFSLFIFIYRNHQPRIFIYRDLTSQTTVPRISLPRSVEFVEEFNEFTKPVSSVPDPIDENSITSSSEPSVPEFQQENNEEPSISDDIAQNITGNPISSDPDSKEDLGEVTGEPMEEEDVPVSSEPDLDLVKQVEDATSSDTEKNEAAFDGAMGEKLRSCDFYQGNWVKDENYPVYGAGSCPYVDEGFDCQNNGRPDSEYLSWRWKPDGCDLPRFNATDFLVRLRGKKLMLVGDSMNRNQFESLLCLLREGITNKTKMYEVHGYKISKGRGYFVFKFEDYDCTVEFVRSHFLVREGVRKNAQGNSNPTLSIDRIDKSARRWQRADILVFNTGHWWTHGKTSRGKNYYKEGNVLYPQFDAVEAYRRAIKTWANWTKRNLKGKLVFYRGYSSAHFRGGDWDSGGSCRGETEPVKSGAIIDSYPEKMTIVEDVLRETKVPAVLLNVTHLTNYRKDGHPSLYGRNVSGGGRRVSSRRQDCSHWCLPGVPDAWNELIYATLVARQS